MYFFYFLRIISSVFLFKTGTKFICSQKRTPSSPVDIPCQSCIKMVEYEKQLWITKTSCLNVFLLNLYRKLCYCHPECTFLQNFVLSPNYRPPSNCFSCTQASCISKLSECLRRGSDKRGSSVLHCNQSHYFSTVWLMQAH